MQAAVRTRKKRQIFFHDSKNDVKHEFLVRIQQWFKSTPFKNSSIRFSKPENIPSDMKYRTKPLILGQISSGYFDPRLASMPE